MSVVSVWHATTAGVLEDDARRARALGWLSRADLVRHERYRFQTDRDMFLLGRVMARSLVARALGVGPREWEWREGPRGRPEIADPAAAGRVSFNIAHSAGLVVCAISTDGGTVGVDVEHRLRPPVDARMVRRYCAPYEVADIERQGPSAWQDQFLKYWTLKEAYLKARGVGIAVHLSDLSFTLGADAIRLERLNSLSADDDADWAFVLDASSPTHFVAAAVTAQADVRPTFSIAPLPHDLLP
jgi:4'-phosphopantetheinyl transferase